MIKRIKYFFEALAVYLFFVIAKIIGLTLSRHFFSLLFRNIGPLIRANNKVDNNIKKLPNLNSEKEKNKIRNNMWSNYGMTFVEYVFLNKFRNSKLPKEKLI